MKGEIPLIHVKRVFDEDGDPLGYEKAVGAILLGNPEQEAAFNKLPERFRHKDAKQIYGKGAQATTDFLKKAVAAGILRKEGRYYVKVKGAD